MLRKLNINNGELSLPAKDRVTHLSVASQSTGTYVSAVKAVDYRTNSIFKKGSLH